MPKKGEKKSTKKKPKKKPKKKKAELHPYQEAAMNTLLITDAEVFHTLVGASCMLVMELQSEIPESEETRENRSEAIGLLIDEIGNIRKFREALDVAAMTISSIDPTEVDTLLDDIFPPEPEGEE